MAGREMPAAREAWSVGVILLSAGPLTTKQMLTIATGDQRTHPLQPQPRTAFSLPIFLARFTVKWHNSAESNFCHRNTPPPPGGFFIAPMATELTPKQQRFVEEYLIDLNATQAAIRAGYSEDTAGSMGHENLKKPEIQAALKEAMDARSQRTQITADMVMAELGRLGFSNIRHYMSWNDSAVQLVPSEELNDDATRCIAEVSQTVTAEGGTVKLKLHDKVSALEKIARHLGMFNDKVKLEGGITLAGSVNVYLPDNGRDKRD
ncbi:terminase small subunit [Gemmata sp. G18]|uniref:Terminase small subunit n=1 Tax=Gemmata palustris TaxID=2822762 RepID=A0ABS5BX93_9BACT|nr:terminase small subunit [Gemmata palustris]MBP3958357.1 terminase small subunit [Gemmata palustris]